VDDAVGWELTGTGAEGVSAAASCASAAGVIPPNGARLNRLLAPQAPTMANARANDPITAGQGSLPASVAFS
jgi:hypothetical protein